MGIKYYPTMGEIIRQKIKRCENIMVGVVANYLVRNFSLYSQRLRRAQRMREDGGIERRRRMHAREPMAGMSDSDRCAPRCGAGRQTIQCRWYSGCTDRASSGLKPRSANGGHDRGRTCAPTSRRSSLAVTGWRKASGPPKRLSAIARPWHPDHRSQA